MRERIRAWLNGREWRQFYLWDFDLSRLADRCSTRVPTAGNKGSNVDSESVQ